MEQNREFTADTAYDEAAYTALVRLMMGKLRRWPRILLLATGFLSVIGGGAFLLRDGEVTLLPLLITLLGSMLCMAGFFAPRIAVRMMMASNKKGGTPVNAYRFADGGICVRSGEDQESFPYGDVLRMLEMSGYLFLFLRGGQMYLLRQADVRPGYPQLKEYLNRQVAAARAPGVKPFSSPESPAADR